MVMSARLTQEQELRYHKVKLVRRLARVGGKSVVKVLAYFIMEPSVGELIAVRELRASGIRRPEKIIGKLVDMGYLTHSLGCYNLSKELRDEILKLAHLENKTMLDEGKELAQLLLKWSGLKVNQLIFQGVI